MVLLRGFSSVSSVCSVGPVRFPFVSFVYFVVPRSVGLHPAAMNWLTWSLLSAVFAAATAILAKIGIAGVDSNLATAVRTTVVVVFAWAIVPLTSSYGAAFTLSRRTLLFLALSGLATGLSWLCYFRALQLGEASRVAPVDKLSVALVILLSAIFLGEPLSRGKLLGGSLIVLGVGILARS